jgi:hypothetical protein
MGDFCELSHEFSGSIKGATFFHQFRDYRPSKKDSVL